MLRELTRAIAAARTHGIVPGVSRTPQPRTLRSWRGRAVVVRVIRVLVALVALQVTGVAHGLADLLVEETLASHVEQERSGDRRDDGDADCPPGCPDCHHVAHALPIVPRATVLDYAPPMARVQVAVAPYLEPPIRPRAPPDRPPRA